MASTTTGAHCFHCGAELDVPLGPVGRGQTCDKCSSDVRCCRNCKFYDPASYNECTESMAERVVDKTKANFCDYFALGSGKGGTADPKADAKKKLDDLFK